jgi:hypothetical protein
MDVLTKIVYKKGIAFSHCFHYMVDEKFYSLTVGEILHRYIEQKKSKAEYLSTLNHLKKSPRHIAISFLDGMGLKMVHQDVLGKDAGRISLVLNMITHSDKGVPLRIVNEIGEVEDWIVARTKGNEFILGKVGEPYESMSHRKLAEKLSVLIKRVVGLPGDENERFYEGENSN